MAALNLTKIAYGCATADVLRQRLDARAQGGTVTIDTRYRPTRFAELIGGSLYWIIAHRIVCRQTILGFEEGEGGRCLIRLDARLVPVRARPKRAHQGWRYLKGEDAPEDFDGDEGELGEMPQRMVDDLAALSLI